MFRQLLGVVGTLSGLGCLACLPVAMLRGDLHHPDILLSDLMKAPGYREVVCFALLIGCAANIYLMIEALRYLRGRASWEVAWSIDVAVCLQVCIFPAFLLVVFFPFGEVGLHWFLHCVGCLLTFVAIAGAGFVYVFFIAPKLSKSHIVPKEDAWYRRWCGISVCSLVVVAAGVRSLHFADNAGWAWSLLAVEIGFCALWNLASVLGNWQTLGEMDRTDPVAFAACSSGEEMNRSHRKEKNRSHGKEKKPSNRNNAFFWSLQ